MAKFWILLIGVHLIGLECVPIDKEKLKTIDKTCRAETGMDKEPIDKALEESRLPAPTITYLKYLECAYRKQGYLEGQNRIVFDNIKDMLSEYYSVAALNEVMEPCKQHHGQNPGENAYKVARCIIAGLNAYEKRTGLEDNVV